MKRADRGEIKSAKEQCLCHVSSKSLVEADATSRRGGVLRRRPPDFLLLATSSSSHPEVRPEELFVGDEMAVARKNFR